MTTSQANFYFQGALYQAEAWKTSYETVKKDLIATNETIATLETKLASSISDSEEAWAKIIILNDEKEKGIDAYMPTPKFKELIEEHDALVHPVSYKEGWNAAVETILKSYPEVATTDSLPCPLEVPRLGGVTEKLVEMIRGEQRPTSSSIPPNSTVADSEGSKGYKRKASSSSGEKESGSNNDGSESKKEPS